VHLNRLRIADLLLELRAPLPPAELGIEQMLGPFFCPVAGPAADVVLNWVEGDPSPPSQARLVYDPGEIWRMYAAGEGGAFHAHIRYPGGQHEAPAEALLTTDPAWSRVRLIERRPRAGGASLLSLGAGELVVRTRILFGRGIVLHACGIEDRGSALVFVGHSGAGKSTLARLWSAVVGAAPINDDRMAVRLFKGGARAYGLPWGGSAGLARNRRLVLRALFLLEQAAAHEAIPLARQAALPLLLARGFLPFWDRDLMARAVAVAEALLQNVPAYLLRWKLDPSVIQLIRSVG